MLLSSFTCDFSWHLRVRLADCEAHCLPAHVQKSGGPALASLRELLEYTSSIMCRQLFALVAAVSGPLDMLPAGAE